MMLRKVRSLRGFLDLWLENSLRDLKMAEFGAEIKASHKVIGE